MRDDVDCYGLSGVAEQSEILAFCGNLSMAATRSAVLSYPVCIYYARSAAVALPTISTRDFEM